MWRKNALASGSNGQESEDSDQSISEEEEGVESEWTGNTISLGGAGDHTGGMQVLSQLEVLRDSYELHSTEKESISSNERKGGYPIDDEVENPLFNDTHPSEGILHFPTMASISHSGEEIISDDENPPSPRSSTQNECSTWSKAGREVEALVRLNENSCSSSSHGVLLKENKSSRGSNTKGKPKLLFRFHSHKEDLSLVVSEGNARKSFNDISVLDEIDGATEKDMEYESQLIFDEEEYGQPENHIVPFEQTNKHNVEEHSVVEFLDCFQGRSDLLQESTELGIKKRGKQAQMVLKRDISSLGDRNIDDDDLSEPLDSASPICSDDEENPLRMIIPGKTMADQFHEAFGIVSVIDERSYLDFPRQSCDGIYGKLQQVMQSEKERDMDYIKNISAATGFKDDGMSISVRILSRSLEAKLIVCSCTLIEDGKNTCWDNNLEMKLKRAAKALTIIFNPRMCSDVELEVGSLIHIHPPWKEVQVKGKEDELILLCSYFSQVQS